MEYALVIIKKFLSKGGRYVSTTYTVGFFEKVTNTFPTLKQTAAEIFAHCLNIEYAPFTDAARLDHETTRFAVGNCPAEPDKQMKRGMMIVIRSHCDDRVKESLCRALYVYERVVWLRAKDNVHIEDALALCDELAVVPYPRAARLAAELLAREPSICTQEARSRLVALCLLAKLFAQRSAFLTHHGAIAVRGKICA